MTKFVFMSFPDMSGNPVFYCIPEAPVSKVRGKLLRTGMTEKKKLISNILADLIANQGIPEKITICARSGNTSRAGDLTY